MRATVLALAAQVAEAPAGTDTATLTARLDRAADALDYEEDEDLGARALQRAAPRTADSGRRVAMLGHALKRARQCASSASAGGEGLARMVHVHELEAALDAATPPPAAVTPYGVPVRVAPGRAAQFAHFVLRHLGARVLRSPGTVPITVYHFDVEAAASRHTVSWTAGTGIPLETPFRVDGRAFRLDFWPGRGEVVVAEGGALDDGEVGP